MLSNAYPPLIASGSNITQISSKLYKCGDFYKTIQNSFEVFLSSELYNSQLSVPTLYADHTNVVKIIGFHHKIEPYFRYFHQENNTKNLDELAENLVKFIGDHSYSFYRREFYELKSESKYLAKDFVKFQIKLF